MSIRTRRWWAAIPLGVLAAALMAACSVSEPPEEVAKELEGVFIKAPETQLDLAMYRGGPTRTGVYNTKGVLEEPAAKWTFEVGRKIATLAVIFGDKIMFGADDGNFYALDVETGEEQWKLETGRQIRISSLVSDGVVYFGANDRTLRAVDVETGQELWSFEAQTDFNSSPAIVKGTIYAPSIRDLFYALDARIGLLKWEKNLNECCAGVLEFFAPAIIGEIGVRDQSNSPRQWEHLLPSHRLKFERHQLEYRAEWPSVRRRCYK